MGAGHHGGADGDAHPRPGVFCWERLFPILSWAWGGSSCPVVLALFLFQVPLRGSVWVLTAVSALFLLAALGMGLLISTVAKNQFVAGQVAIITTYLPAFLLSGFIFEINSMPRPIQAITPRVCRAILRLHSSECVRRR